MAKAIKTAAILFGCIIFILPTQLPVYATPKDTVRIILLETMPVAVVLEHSKWFISELNALGYRDGANLDLLVIQANGDRARAKQMLNRAMEKTPAVVVSNATLASQAAMDVLNDTGIPLIFMTVSDPVGAGLIKEIGTPTGTNITGRVHMINRETRINMVMQLINRAALTKPVRMGFIHSSYPSAAGDFKALQSIAKNREDIVFVPHEIEYKKIPDGLPEMLSQAAAGIELLEQGIDFWWEPSGPLGELTQYTQLLLDRSQKPIIMGTKLKSVALGALMHLTPSIKGSGQEVARIVDAVLKGSDPGAIPPLPPADFDMGINLETSVRYGLVIPPDLLKLAGDNVYP